MQANNENATGRIKIVEQSGLPLPETFAQPEKS
jgi:hypothetical protein